MSNGHILIISIRFAFRVICFVLVGNCDVGLLVLCLLSCSGLIVLSLIFIISMVVLIGCYSSSYAVLVSWCGLVSIGSTLLAWIGCRCSLRGSWIRSRRSLLWNNLSRLRLLVVFIWVISTVWILNWCISVHHLVLHIRCVLRRWQIRLCIYLCFVIIFHYIFSIVMS